MICHIVLYEIKAGKGEKDAKDLLSQALRILPGLPGVQNLRAGESIKGPEKGYSIALVMDFQDDAALEAYRVNSDHQKFIKEVAGPRVENILRFDFRWS